MRYSSPNPVAFLSLLAGLACAAPAPPPSAEAPRAEVWAREFGVEHPLVGGIWSPSSGTFLSEEALLTRLVSARFVLLGEQHDNPDHHRLQARVIRALTQAGRRPALAFEMLSSDDAEIVARYRSEGGVDAAELGPELEWDARGWPDWSMYAPIAQAALDADLPIRGADFTRERKRTLRREGQEALDPSEVARLALEPPLDAELDAALRDRIRLAHCGTALESSLDAMVLVQRARDGRMADALLSAPGSDGAVLIAGAGHARSDWAVPLYLRRRAPQAPLISIAWIEVDDERLDPVDYEDRVDGARFPFDALWFTPRSDEEDPCEKFEKQLERLRKPVTDGPPDT